MSNNTGDPRADHGSEREDELVAALESVLTDARYALDQCKRARCHGYLDNSGSSHVRAGMECVQRAVDALERIQCNVEAGLTATAEVEADPHWGLIPRS